MLKGSIKWDCFHVNTAQKLFANERPKGTREAWSWPYRFGLVCETSDAHVKELLPAKYTENPYTPASPSSHVLDPNPKQFPCEYCPKSFSRTSDLKEHVKHDHGHIGLFERLEMLMWKNSSLPSMLKTHILQHHHHLIFNSLEGLQKKWPLHVQKQAGFISNSSFAATTSVLIS